MRRFPRAALVGMLAMVASGYGWPVVAAESPEPAAGAATADAGNPAFEPVALRRAGRVEAARIAGLPLVDTNPAVPTRVTDGSPEARPSPAPGATSARPQFAVTAPSLPLTQAGFAGVGEATACFGAPCPYPPAPRIAVGADWVVEAVNRDLRITDRVGAAALDLSLQSFFVLTSTGAGRDPQVGFDAVHGRWIAAEASSDCARTPTTGHLELAVSETGDPTGAWDVFSFDLPGGMADSLRFAAGAQTVVVAFGQNDLAAACTEGAPDGTRVLAVDWSALLGNPASLPAALTAPDAGILTWRAAADPSTSSVQLVGEAAPGGDVLLATFTGTVASGTSAIGNRQNLTDAGVITALVPPGQPGMPAGMTVKPAIDERPDSPSYARGLLTFASTVGCQLQNVNADCVRLVQLRIGPSISLVQDVLVGTAGYDTFGGSVATTATGALVVAYVRSSGGAPLASFAVYRSPSATSLSAPIALASGAAGDADGWTSGASLAIDPSDPTAAWAVEQHPTAAGWASRVSQLQAPGAAFVAMTPTRIVDSRRALGIPGPLSSGQPRTFAVAGRAGVPSDAIAVSLNVTVTGARQQGFVTVGPSVAAAPATSTINFAAGDTRANHATIALAGNGSAAAVYNAKMGTGTASLVVDVTGYYTLATGATLHAVAPVRLVDTRTGKGIAGKLASGKVATFHVAGANGVPAGATAVLGTVTGVRPTVGGYISMAPALSGLPPTSTLNLPTGAIRANEIALPLAGDGTAAVQFLSSPTAGTTDLVFDVTGYFLAGDGGSRFVPIAPQRQVDTRIGLGLPTALAAGVAVSWPAAGRSGISANASAVAGNVTAVYPTSSGFLAVAPSFSGIPTTSTVNFVGRDIAASAFTSGLSSRRIAVGLWPSYAGKCDAVVDVTGFYR